MYGGARVAAGTTDRQTDGGAAAGHAAAGGAAGGGAARSGGALIPEAPST